MNSLLYETTLSKSSLTDKVSERTTFAPKDMLSLTLVLSVKGLPSSIAGLSVSGIVSVETLEVEKPKASATVNVSNTGLLKLKFKIC